jgi:hypothetical protein
MKNLKSYIEEGLLRGMEDTLAAGDKINEQFNRLKQTILNKYSYNKLYRNSYITEINNIDELLSVLGIKAKKDSSIMIEIIKITEVYAGWGDYEDEWKFKFDLYGGDLTIHNKQFWPAKNLSFPKLLATKIEPIVRDIESFKKFIDDNNRKR